MEKIILFDGQCPICNRFIRFVINRDKKSVFKFASINTETGRYILNKAVIEPKLIPDSIALISDTEVFFKSSAVLRILSELRSGMGFWKAVSLLRIVPKQARDFVYDIIALNRERLFGRVEECGMLSKKDMDRFIDK